MDMLWMCGKKRLSDGILCTPKKGIVDMSKDVFVMSLHVREGVAVRVHV